MGYDPDLSVGRLLPALALTIGGSDSGGGAGIQADLKTFTMLRVHGCSALTCVTAQNTLGVQRLDPLPAAAVTAQVEAVCRDLPPAALKTGMLLDRDRIVATALAITPLAIPRVIDPVMVSRAGTVLLEPEAIDLIDGDDTVWEREPMEQLAERGQLAAFRHEGFWQPMDTLRDKQSLEALWSSGRAPWRSW